MVKVYNHPYSNNGYVCEHRLKMEKKIGRYLQPGEEVHHIDGNKLNNNLNNLILFKNHSEHIAYEHKTGRRIQK